MSLPATRPLKQLIRRGRRRALFMPGETTREVSLGSSDVLRLLPHRKPFLFVDGIDALDVDKKAIRGHRWIDPDDPVLAGHFPGDPVYPGALILETLGQLCVCFHNSSRRQEKVPGLRLVGLHHASFVEEVRPGDRLTLLGMQIEDNGLTALYAGQALKENRVCTLAVMEVLMLEGDDE